MRLSAPLLGACAKVGDAAGAPKHLKLDERISRLLLLLTGSRCQVTHLTCCVHFATKPKSKAPFVSVTDSLWDKTQFPI